MAVRIEPSGGVERYLTALRAFNRNVKLFLVITAFRGMVIAALATVLNLYLYSLGYDARFIGLINAANSLAVLQVSVPMGYMADRVGRRKVLVAGGIAYPLSILGLALSSSTSTILAFNFLFGGCAAAYWAAGVLLLYASTHADQRVQAFSINFFLLWGLGPVAALLSVQVVEIAARSLQVCSSSSSALRVGMIFMAGLALIGALPYLFLLDTGQSRKPPGPPPPAGRIARLFVQLLLPDLVLAFGLGSVLTFIQLYFHLRFRLDPGAVGLMLAAAGGVAGAGTLLTPVVARRWGNLRTTVRFQWLCAPAIAVLALSTQLAVAVPVYCVVLTLRGMSDPVYTAFVQERVPGQYRARLTGLYSVTYSIGFSLGPAVSGQLQKMGGFTPAFLTGTACYFCGTTLLHLFFGRDRAVARTAVGSGVA